MKLDYLTYLSSSSILICCLFASTAKAQITPDNTLPQNSQVTRQGNEILINGGTKEGSNLFHSFEEFSVSVDDTAFFDNALDVKNILSRVTGNSISDIQGIIKTNGAANLFLVNPNGIIFGENALLQVGGSFLATTADGILFPDGEFSATDLDSPPLITINAPIGLNFRDNPGEIINYSFTTDESGEDLIGLRVSEDQTIALIGGDIFIDGGFVTTPGGRVELGSVGENSVVTLTEVDKGWDFSYGGVQNFQDVNLSFAAFIETFGADTGGIELQGKNVSLIEGSQLAVNTEVGTAGDIKVVATESLSLDGNAIEADVEFGDIPTAIFNDVLFEATGEGSQINLETPQLSLTNGAAIYSTNLGIDPNSKGVSIAINASDIVVKGSFIDNELDIFSVSGISATVDLDELNDGTLDSGTGIGKGGNITINTDKLTLNEGGQINTGTFSQGNAGNLTINATESIKLIGTVVDSNIPSGLFADVGTDVNAVGNSGNLTLTAKNLTIRDGAQVSSSAQNEGKGGNLTIDVSESILVTGVSPLAELRGEGRSGILVGVEPFFEDDNQNLVITTGNGGNLNLTSPEIIVEDGGQITANTFSLGEGGNATLNVDKLIISQGGEVSAGSVLEVDNIEGNNERGAGGNLTINATESVEIFGTGNINGETVKSSLFALAEGTGDAGDLSLTTDKLSVSDGGEINASAIGSGAAGELSIKANNLSLDQGTITASTAAGEGGNVELEIAENITLRNNSLISAQAFDDADGGNLTIDTQFIIATPNQNSDILASAEKGKGGNIQIIAEALLGIEPRDLNNITNDINASSERNVDGTISITTPEVNSLRTNVELDKDVVKPETLVSQGCYYEGEETRNGLVVKGKGGVAPEPTEPFSMDVINLERNTSTTTQSYSPITEPVVTQAENSKGKNVDNFIPARGVIVEDDGTIILTAYPTHGTPGYRSYQQKIACQTGDNL